MVAITPADILYQEAHKDDDRRSALYGTAATMIVLPTIVVGLRLACRRHLKAPIAHDDIAIIVALVLCWALSAMLVLCAHYGSGRHTILAPIPNLIHFVQMELAIELTYCVLITTTKFSILLLYRRIFINQTTSRSFRMAWYAVTFWCFAWGISTFFAALFQCTPISYTWTQFTMKTEGTCLDLKALLLATAIVNILTDVAVLVLPMPIVWNLKIQRSQKVAVSGIFLLGGFVCVTSIIRSSYLPKVVSPDPMWEAVNGGIFSIIEPGVGIICASLSSLGPILRKTLPLRSLNRSREPRKFSYRPFGSGSGASGKTGASEKVTPVALDAWDEHTPTSANPSISGPASQPMDFTTRSGLVANGGRPGHVGSAFP